MRNLHTSLLMLFFLFSNFYSIAQADISCGETRNIDNSGGTDVLEVYPIRPGFIFRANEVITPIADLECVQEVCITTANRPPGDIDAFVLTDTTDAASAILWVNGFGTTACFTPVVGQKYYLVVDGLSNTMNNMDVTIACTEITDCIRSSEIPTMSQWGLMIFTLLLFNLSIYFIRRQELIVE